MPNVKVVIVFAASAAVLSLFAGIFGGVAFGVILLRMFLGALVFGALGAAISLLATRFMPDLFAAQESEEEAGSTGGEAPEAAQGSQVDIVLDDEDQASPVFSSVSEDEEDSEDEEEAEDEDRFIEEVHRSEDHEQEEAASTADDFVEEAEGSAVPSSGGAKAEPSKTAASSAAPSGGGGRGDTEFFENVEDIDELPDLEEYADSFESVAVDTKGDDSGGIGGHGGSSVDIDGEQQDPATVAKALRRFMKEDEEG